MTNLLCLGDSITDCGRILSTPPLGNGYVSYISRYLNKEGFDCFITNLGTDGFTIERLLENTSRYYSVSRPDLITILIGINDIGLMMNTNRTAAQQDKMMGVFFYKYDQLLIRLLPLCPNIMLMEPFIFPCPLEYQGWISLVKKMSLGIEKLSRKYSLPYLYLHDELNKQGRLYGMDSVTTDGIHLTAWGHELLARLLMPHLLHFIR